MMVQMEGGNGVEKYADIIIDISTKQVDRVFQYKIPQELIQTVQVGSRVMVPFGKGNKPIVGYVTGFKDKSEFKNLKKIICAVDEEPMLDEKSIELAK